MHKRYTKIIQTGDIFEVKEYEKLNLLGGGRKEGNGINKDENYKIRKKLRRDKIRQLVTMNFDSGSKFVTLTYRDGNKTDVKQCNKDFKTFIQRLKYQYPELLYLAVIEFMKNGRIHYHMICNLPYIPNKQLNYIWGHGFVRINRIEKVDNVGAYIVKYMTTDFDDKRLMGLKAYNHSKGLQKPVEYVSWEPSDFNRTMALKEFLQKNTPSYTAMYESENAGQIIYSQYNMKRIKYQSQDIVSPLPNSSVMTSSL